MKFLLVFLTMILLVACGNDECSSNNNETEIKRVVEAEFNQLIDAARKLDMNLILSYYSNDVTAIEQGHMHNTAEEFRNSYRNAVETVSEVHKIEILNPRIKVLSPNVVIFEAKLNQEISLKSGERINAINVLSLVYNQIDGEWKIVHHHGSFPTTN